MSAVNLCPFLPSLPLLQVCNEVIDSSAGVRWDDIAGLEVAKQIVGEVVVWPMLNPHIFHVSGKG